MGLKNLFCVVYGNISFPTTISRNNHVLNAIQSNKPRHKLQISTLLLSQYLPTTSAISFAYRPPDGMSPILIIINCPQP